MRETAEQGRPFVEAAPGGVYIDIRLLPRASRNAVTGPEAGRLRIKLTAPPVEGAANRALVGLLSKTLGVKKSSIKITSGLRSRNKRVFVEGLESEEAERRLTAGKG